MFLGKTFNNFCNSTFPPLICPDGSIACSTVIATLFGSHFYANSSFSNFNAPDPLTLHFTNPMPSINISAQSLLGTSFLKDKQGFRPDSIPPRLLEEFANEVIPVLCHLFHS